MIASDLGDGANRYFKNFVENIPIPKITSSNQHLANNLIDLCQKRIQADERELNGQDIENKIDSLVYQLYELTDEEIEIIEKIDH